MKAELQKQLLVKYPEFFTSKKKIYTGDSTEQILKDTIELLNQKEIVEPIQFGFECGDGWYMLLDELMDEIQNHLENENRSRANEFKFRWIWKLQAYLRRKRLTVLAEWLYDNAPRKKPNPLTVSVTQIKEKFGGLCFYYNGGDDDIYGMTRLAESLSYKICEHCGTTINVGKTQGWIYVCCKSCHNANPRAKNLTWIPNDTTVLTMKDLQDIDIANDEKI
jgi:hypothetical protein